MLLLRTRKSTSGFTDTPGPRRFRTLSQLCALVLFFATAATVSLCVITRASVGTTLLSNDTADLAVTNVDNIDPIAAGGSLTYSLTVVNNGPDLATGVVLSDTLLPTVSFVSAVPSLGSCAQGNNLVTCDLGNLGSGATATITISVTPNVAGIISSTATVTGNQIDSNGANNSISQQTRVTGAAGPSVISATVFNPPGVTNNVGGDFDVAIVESTGLVYVSTTGAAGNEIGVIHQGSNTLIKAIQLPGSGTVHFSRVNQAAGILYFLLNASPTSVLVVDGRPSSPTFNTLLAPLPLSGQTIVSFDVDEVRSLLYVTSSLTTNPNSSKITIIDANPLSSTFNQAVGEVTFPAGASVGAAAVNAVTNKIYFAASGTQPGIYVLDGVSRNLTRITSTVNSRSVIVNTANNLIYGGSVQLNAIDGNNDSLLSVINLPAPISGTNETMALNRTNGRVAMRSSNASVLVVDGQRGSPSFNTVVGQVPVSDLSAGIGFDEASNRIVVISQTGLKTSIIDASNTVVAVITSAEAPSGMAIDAQTHKAFVANQFDFVQKINVATGTLEATIQTMSQAFPGVANTNNHLYYLGRNGLTAEVLFVDKDGQIGQVSGLPHNIGRYLFYASNDVTNRIYAENSSSNLAGDRFSVPGFVSVIDGITNNVIANVQVGNQPFGQIAVNQTTNKIYVSNAGFGSTFPSSVMVIDGATNSVTTADTTAFPANTQFLGRIVVSESANKVYFTAGGTLGVLNGATNIATPLVFAGVSDYAVNNALNRLYVLYSDVSGAHLAIVDCDTNGTITTLNFGLVGSSSLTLAVNKVTARVFVNINGNVQVVNGITNIIEATIPAAGFALLGLNELANHIYLGNASTREFSILNGNNLTITSTLALPFAPQQASVDPFTARIFVGCFGYIDPAGIAVIADSTHSISGIVRDQSGNPLGGITVSLSGTLSASVSTNAGGAFLFDNLPEGGSFTVAPSSSGFSFSPASQSFNNLTIDRIANFVGTQTTVSISGKVTDSGNAGLASVTLALTQNGLPAGTTSSDASGNYSFNNLTAGANYVVLPAGSFTPTSQTFNNLTANATSDFKVLPGIPPQCNTPAFSKTDFGTGASPFATVAGDFNGDGNVDLASGNITAGEVAVLLGSGNGSFGAATNFPAAAGTYSLAVADLNNDGKLDVVTANNNSNSISILLGNGNGTLAPAMNFTGVTGPRSVTVRDFNGDGKLDLAVANFFGNNVSVFLGDGTGSVGPATTFAAGTNATSVTAGDFNSDGKLDLAVANFGPDNVSILLGNGAGSFSAPTNFAAGTDPFFIRTADFNTDGKLDLAVPNVNSNNVSVFLGTGTGTFGAATNFAVGVSPTSVVIGDFNGDGKTDLATTNNTVTGTVSVLLGTGTGTFGSATNFSTGSSSRPGIAGDFNNDGKTDLAVANQGSNDISVLLNTAATCNTQTSVSISGRVSTAINQALPEVTVTLSGPITRVVQSDASGNYSFPNLAPGGNYAVTVQSSYFVTAPSRADFFNLTSNQTANFLAAAIAIPSPTPTPNDDFTSTVRDASKWTIGTQSAPAVAFDPQVTTTQVNGQLVITPLTQATGLHYDGYVSANSFDLRNGSAHVEVVKAATGGADTIFAIGTDSENFYRFMVHTAGVTTSLVPSAKGRDGIDRPLDATVAQLVFQVAIGGPPLSFSIPYDPVQHRFMRFRHEPPTNSILFETSPNDVDYTVRHSVTLQKSISALTAELSAGTSNPTNPGPAVFDNFTLVTSTFQFSAGSYVVGEVAGSILITVTRAGSLANPASVDFTTTDGTARQKTRYTSTAGTLAFGAGLSTRTFRVLLADNLLAEGDQTLNLLLSNPVGSGLNSPGRAVLTISDNDTTVATTNSLDDARYFVTQHYYDFLSRLPDQSGLDYWTSQITMCGADENCLRTQRITVSNAFFFEQEYQQTGAYVVRVYRAAYGNNQPFSPSPNPQFPNEEKKLVNYAAFSPDRARVRGGAQLAQTQLDLANAFVLRPQFVAKYPSSLDGPGFVDAILATISNDSGVNLSSQRNALLDLFNQGGRGAVLYRLADDNATNPVNNRAFIDAEYNRAFVLTQYFGYLRRNPDIGGFLFWLGQVNSVPLRSLEKQRAMVCSFITSIEYQQRFSSVATHNNSECQ